jgi:hypothetical protein
MNRPFRTDELSGPDAPGDPAELAAALEVARVFERSVGVDGVRPTPGFSDRVMAAVALEPAPRRSRLAVLLGALRSTWQTVLNANRPPLVRAQALAIVLVVMIALGSIGGAATLAAAGALNLFQAHPTSGPLITPVPQPRVSPDSTEAPKSSKSPEPTESVGPVQTPEVSETPEPGETPEPTSSDRPGGGDGSKATSGPGHTPEPTETPEPTDTPEPSDH